MVIFPICKFPRKHLHALRITVSTIFFITLFTSMFSHHILSIITLSVKENTDEQLESRLVNLPSNDDSFPSTQESRLQKRIDLLKGDLQTILRKKSEMKEQPAQKSINPSFMCAVPLIADITGTKCTFLKTKHLLQDQSKEHIEKERDRLMYNIFQKEIDPSDGNWGGLLKPKIHPTRSGTDSPLCGIPLLKEGLSSQDRNSCNSGNGLPDLNEWHRPMMAVSSRRWRHHIRENQAIISEDQKMRKEGRAIQAAENKMGRYYNASLLSRLSSDRIVPAVDGVGQRRSFAELSALVTWLFSWTKEVHVKLPGRCIYAYWLFSACRHLARPSCGRSDPTCGAALTLSPLHLPPASSNSLWRSFAAGSRIPSPGPSRTRRRVVCLDPPSCGAAPQISDAPRLPPAALRPPTVFRSPFAGVRVPAAPWPRPPGSSVEAPSPAPAAPLLPPPRTDSPLAQPTGAVWPWKTAPPPPRGGADRNELGWRREQWDLFPDVPLSGPAVRPWMYKATAQSLRGCAGPDCGSKPGPERPLAVSESDEDIPQPPRDPPPEPGPGTWIRGT